MKNHLQNRRKHHFRQPLTRHFLCKSKKKKSRGSTESVGENSQQGQPIYWDSLKTGSFVRGKQNIGKVKSNQQPEPLETQSGKGKDFENHHRGYTRGVRWWWSSQRRRRGSYHDLTLLETSGKGDFENNRKERGWHLLQGSREKKNEQVAEWSGENGRWIKKEREVEKRLRKKRFIQ